MPTCGICPHNVLGPDDVLVSCRSSIAKRLAASTPGPVYSNIDQVIQPYTITISPDEIPTMHGVRSMYPSCLVNEMSV
jgi:hypothetical protein